MGTRIDLKGKKFGELTIIKEQGKSKWGYIKWLCKCSCGNEKVFDGGNIRSGHIKSCGCLKSRKPNGLKHGMSKTSFYRLWRGMLIRCYKPKNKNYKYYGARGIKVSDRWHKFENFRDDMYKFYLFHKENNTSTTIERVDNDGDYETLNCTWATRAEQNRNKRVKI